MRKNQIAYYAALYPVLIGAMTQVIADNASAIERAFEVSFALAFAIAGPFVWTRLEHWFIASCRMQIRAWKLAAQEETPND